MKFNVPPLNRIVAFAGPYISLVSGGIASWLVVHVQVFGSLGLGRDQLAHGIAYGTTAVVGAALPHLGMQKWLEGHKEFVSDVFGLAESLGPDVKKRIAEVLPAVNGDILKAVETVVGTAGLEAAHQGEEEAEHDVEQDNQLVDIVSPPSDPLPDPSTLGDDSVHAPPGAEVAPAAAPAGAAKEVGA